MICVHCYNAIDWGGCQQSLLVLLLPKKASKAHIIWHTSDMDLQWGNSWTTKSSISDIQASTGLSQASFSFSCFRVAVTANCIAWCCSCRSRRICSVFSALFFPTRFSIAGDAAGVVERFFQECRLFQQPHPSPPSVIHICTL